MQAIGSKQWAHDLVREYEAGPKHRTRAPMTYRMAYQALRQDMPDPHAQVCSGAPAPAPTAAPVRAAAATPVPNPRPVPAGQWWQDDDNSSEGEA